jgi:hypothetical protein
MRAALARAAGRERPVDETEALYREGMEIATLSRAIFSGPTVEALAAAGDAVSSAPESPSGKEAASRAHKAITAMAHEIIGEPARKSTDQNGGR